MAPPHSRRELASALVHAALESANRRPAGTRSIGPLVSESITLDWAFAPDDAEGLARFTTALAHAVQPLEIDAVRPTATMTVAMVVAEMAARLPARVFRCQDPDVHLYKERGTGRCRIDGTDLVEIL